MKVKELIEELSKYDPDLEVVSWDDYSIIGFKETVFAGKKYIMLLEED